MRYTLRRIAFGILTSPVVVLVYALAVIALGGTRDIIYGATWYVVAGWVALLVFAPRPEGARWD